jgi:hypothetical protein
MSCELQSFVFRALPDFGTHSVVRGLLTCPVLHPAQAGGAGRLSREVLSRLVEEAGGCAARAVELMLDGLGGMRAEVARAEAAAAAAVEATAAQREDLAAIRVAAEKAREHDLARIKVKQKITVPAHVNI